MQILRAAAVAAIVLPTVQMALAQSEQNIPAAQTMDSPSWSTSGSNAGQVTTKAAVTYGGQKPSAAIPLQTQAAPVQAAPVQAPQMQGTSIPTQVTQVDLGQSARTSAPRYTAPASVTAPAPVNIAEPATAAPTSPAQVNGQPNPVYGWPTNATVSAAGSTTSSDTPQVSDGQVVTTPVDPAQYPNQPAQDPALYTRKPVRDFGPDGQVVTSVPSRANELPEGTLISTRLTQAIWSNADFIGTQFTAVLSEPVTKDGYIVIPANSTLRGRVMRANSANLLHGGATIMLRPDEIICPDGTRFLIHAIVVRTDARSNTKTKGEGMIVDDPSKVKQAVTFGAITGGGAVTGAVLGGPVGAGVGAGVGAALGTAQWVGHRRTADLPQDSQLIFSLSEPMSLEGYQSVSHLNSVPAVVVPAQQPHAVPAPAYVPPATATTPY